MADRAAAAARDLLTAAIRTRVFPAAVAEVGDGRGAIWSEPYGALTFEEGAHPCGRDTIFDLASLAKPLATANLAMQLVERRMVGLGDPIMAHFDQWRGVDREDATIQDLLEHCSGLAARLVDLPPVGRLEFEHDICSMALEYAPRTKSIYSDLGYILLGFMAEDRGGASLQTQFDAMSGKILQDDFLGFEVPAEARGRTAPTLPLNDDLRRGRMLVGEVHDSYAAALGGRAGHAGLFGTAAAVGRFARVMLGAARGDRSQPPPFTPPLVARMTRKSAVPGSSRALGWDTMLPSSSCGTEMSPAAFGHVGFTGTSVSIDPVLDRYFVLLTNRVCGGGTLDEMRDVRRAFHDAATKIGF